ncbi:uncharacterized protein LOC135155059 [Lytechinus pictus]|uniref:uncharacterized protein LOC135155059 n=1 Tax=Lytechinus pictus TaxID=7653 RepID=UPI0030BA17C5
MMTSAYGGHAVVVLVLTIFSCETEGFGVSIMRGKYLPVIGEDFTLVCTYTLQARNREITWEKDGESLATCDCGEDRSCRFTVLDQWKFSLLADDSSANLTIKQLVGDDGGHYKCSVRQTAFSYNTVSKSMHVTPLLPVLPSSTTIFQSGNDKVHQTSTVIYVQQGSSASITCQSIGSRPAVEVTWSIDDPGIPPGNKSLSKTQNALDGSLFDTKSTFNFHLCRKYLGLILWCFVYLGEDFVERQYVTISTYAPPDEVVMTFLAELKEGIKVTVICKAANGYPAPRIYWYIGSRNMTGHSSLNTSENEAGRYDAEGTLTFVPKRLDHGKHLLCFAVQTTVSTTWSVNDSMVLIITGLLDWTLSLSSQMEYHIWCLFALLVFGKGSPFTVSTATIYFQPTQTLPVKGEDFTMECIYWPPSNLRTVKWKHEETPIASEWCTTASECTPNIYNPSKYKLLGDDSSTSLTIINLNTGDNGIYTCNVLNLHGERSATEILEVLNPVPPSRVFMSDAHWGRQYLNNANISITAGESFSITCEANRAKPPAALQWLVPEDVTVVHQDQSDIIQDGSYISRKTLTITPTRVDHEKSLSCIASHPEIQRSLRSSVLLNVHGSTSTMSSATISFQPRQILPVKGEEFTMRCTYSPPLNDRTVHWTHEGIQVAYESCTSASSCTSNILNLTKYKLMGDDRSTSLTIINLTSSDNGIFTCNVFYPDGKHSANEILEVLNPVPPSQIFMSDTQSGRQYLNNANISVIAGDSYSITCGANRARPPAELHWQIPEDVTVDHQDQSEVIHYGSYISQKTLAITSTRDDHGKILSCTASHPELQNNIRFSVFVNVHVLPASVLLFPTGGNQSQSTVLYVQEDSPTSITCKSIGSFPATELSFWLVSESDRTRIHGNVSSNMSVVDDTLFDTESTITIRPDAINHGMHIICSSYMEGAFFVEIVAVRLIVYGLQDKVVMTVPGDMLEGRESKVTCRARNGYPAPLLRWYIGSKSVTNSSSLKISVNSAERYDVVSTLIFIPNKCNHGKRIFCQTVQPMLSTVPSVNNLCELRRPLAVMTNYLWQMIQELQK